MEHYGNHKRKAFYCAHGRLEPLLTLNLFALLFIPTRVMRLFIKVVVLAVQHKSATALFIKPATKIGNMEKLNSDV